MGTAPAPTIPGGLSTKVKDTLFKYFFVNDFVLLFSKSIHNVKLLANSANFEYLLQSIKWLHIYPLFLRAISCFLCVFGVQMRGSRNL